MAAAPAYLAAPHGTPATPSAAAMGAPPCHPCAAPQPPQYCMWPPWAGGGYGQQYMAAPPSGGSGMVWGMPMHSVVTAPGLLPGTCLPAVKAAAAAK